MFNISSPLLLWIISKGLNGVTVPYAIIFIVLITENLMLKKKIYLGKLYSPYNDMATLWQNILMVIPL